MTTDHQEEYGYIEEEEVEMPNIRYQTEWEEFGNIKLEINQSDEQTEAEDSKKKLKSGKKTIKKKIIKHVVPYKFNTNKSEDSQLKNSDCGLALFEGNALFDGTFFTFIAEYYVENTMKKTLNRKFKGKCELCTNPTYIVGTGSSTFNFLRHLRRRHGTKTYDAYISYKKTKNSRSKSDVSIKVNNIINKEEFVPIYVAAESAWKQFGNSRAKRPISSIILNEGVCNRILDDATDFVLNSSWYLEQNIPYRRTYLLHGPSGCGKSSLVFALASELNFGICVLHATDRELTDEKLNFLLNTSPENCVILLENIDTAFSRNDNTDYECNQLTTNGILNSLDGVTAPEGRIIFITCTDITKLDPMLLRPGRVDVKEHLGYCSQYQIMSMFEKFYGGASAAEFCNEILSYEKPVSPAQLQGFFSSHKYDDVERLKLDIEKVWDF